MVYVGGHLRNPFKPEDEILAAAAAHDDNFVPVSKMSQMRNPAPSSCIVYLDEQADSINDAAYFPPSSTPSKYTWHDLPGNYHSGGGSFSFADGHSEIHKWQSSVVPGDKTIPKTGGFTAFSVPDTDRDALWMRERTQRKPGAL